MQGGVWGALIASLLAGLATGLGGVPLLFWRKDVPRRLSDLMLGFAAGVMLAATAFSLLVPALEQGGLIPGVGGVVVGALFLYALDRLVPHVHPALGRQEGLNSTVARVWLLILAITIHNFPEGFSVGVVMGTGDVQAGLGLALAMALQNIPEGLAVAAPLVREGYSKGRALLYAALSGLAEPVAGTLGALAVQSIARVLPWALAFAAGAMLYVVSDEMIPESHREGYEVEATLGFIAGFVVMMALDNAFG
jgi:ZIP family zinc transporter